MCAWLYVCMYGWMDVLDVISIWIGDLLGTSSVVGQIQCRSFATRMDLSMDSGKSLC